MSFILNIDTAVQTASVCLANNKEILGLRLNPTQKDHAAWLHLAIKEILEENGIKPSGLNAVAVSAGPGSYTGLRVAMSAAKGLCYALKIPLITINTLTVMAASAPRQGNFLLCPMIDARRQEVFTAVYDSELNLVNPATNLVLDANSFSALLNTHTICFFGNGSLKFRALTEHPHALFETIETHAGHMVLLSYAKYKKQEWADLAYTEPFYGKDFHSLAKQSL